MTTMGTSPADHDPPADHDLKRQTLPNQQRKKKNKRGKRGGATVDQQLAFRMLVVLDRVIKVIFNNSL